jgi:hypothetical protein
VNGCHKTILIAVIYIESRNVLANLIGLLEKARVVNNYISASVLVKLLQVLPPNNIVPAPGRFALVQQV